MGRRKPIPLIRQIEIQPILDLLDEVGAPISRLLARGKLPTRVRDRADGFASARSLLRFVGLAADYTEWEDLGWCAATRARPEQLGAWGEPVSRCWTLRAAILNFCALYPREISFVELGLAYGAEQAWLWRRRDLTPVDPRGELHGEQFMLGSMVRVVRMAAGHQWSPSAIRLESRCSDWVLRTEGLRSARVSFGGPVLAIAVPYALLDRRLRRPTSAESAAAREETDVLVPSDFVESLQRAVVSMATAAPLSLELGAEIAETSPRTLRRWLAEEGTSWRRLVDRARFEACERLMRDPSLTLTGISAELGYSDQAHFARAFRRVTGSSPREYRARHHGVAASH